VSLQVGGEHFKKSTPERTVLFWESRLLYRHISFHFRGSSGLLSALPIKVELVKCSVVNPDPHGSALILVGWLRIQEGKNDPQKQKQNTKIIVF
jgi:hypothetical protein